MNEHMITVPTTKAGYEMYRRHLAAGNQAAIVTYTRVTKITPKLPTT